MVEMKQFDIGDAESMEALGAAVAAAMAGRGTVYLAGELGTGKTTLVRGALRHMGHVGAVKSPTFTLLEPYEISGRPVYHFDLYRVEDADELELMGFRDYLREDALCFVEWPERGADALPSPDLSVRLEYRGLGRRATLAAGTRRGAEVLARLSLHIPA